MINIRTERLKVVALNAKQLLLAEEDFQRLEREIGVTVTQTKLDEEMQYAMQVRRRKVLEDEEHYLWLTNWAIISMDTNSLVGFVMLKGRPNKAGEVIIGYGIESEYRCKGYATEAVGGLVNWVFENPEAKYVIADTEKINVSSHKVLIKNGAEKYRETDELLWWKIKNSKIS